MIEGYLIAGIVTRHAQNLLRVGRSIRR